MNEQTAALLFGFLTAGYGIVMLWLASTVIIDRAIMWLFTPFLLWGVFFIYMSGFTINLTYSGQLWIFIKVIEITVFVVLLICMNRFLKKKKL